MGVLILVLMEIGQNHHHRHLQHRRQVVLILVLMEYGQNTITPALCPVTTSLNPCSNGNQIEQNCTDNDSNPVVSLNPCSNGNQIEQLCAIEVDPIKCLNPCSNGNQIELGNVSFSNIAARLNPCSNGNQIEQNYGGWCRP